MDKRLLAACGFLAPIVFLVSMLLSVALFPGYDPSVNFVSDLGVSQIFRIGVAASSLLGIAFSLLLLEKVRKLSAFIFLAGSVTLMGVAFFNDTSSGGHTVSAGLFFVLQAVANVLIGLEVKREAGYFMVFSAIAAAAFLITREPLIEHLAIFAFCGSTIMLAARMSRKYIRIVRYV